jgi:hypothetical protein
MSPETLDIGELGDLLKALRDSIAGLTPIEGEGQEPPPVLLGLGGFSRGSVIAILTSPVPEIVEPAISRFNAAIRKGDLTDVPDVSIEGVKRILSLTKKHEVDAQFFGGKATKRPSSVITPRTEFRTPAIVSGETTLYGKVERAGGATAARVLLRIPERHALLPCDADEQIARELGARMYEWVMVSGDATWNAKDLSLRSFRIRRVDPFDQKTSLVQAFDELRAAVGPAWEGTEVLYRLSEERRE